VFLILARESTQGLSREPVCINDILSEELARSRILLENRNIDIHQSADCILVIDASEKVLSVLIGNLLRNAINYTEAGQIRIHAGHGLLSIEDSGIGIPRQQVERIFQPFFRGSSARRSGHGVGLAIVKRLCDRFGWSIHIDSTEQVGTRVVVQFPDWRCDHTGDGT
jgi:signal transduction histidine kinase